MDDFPMVCMLVVALVQRGMPNTAKRLADCTSNPETRIHAWDIAKAVRDAADRVGYEASDSWFGGVDVDARRMAKLAEAAMGEIYEAPFPHCFQDSYDRHENGVCPDCNVGAQITERTEKRASARRAACA